MFSYSKQSNAFGFDITIWHQKETVLEYRDNSCTQCLPCFLNMCFLLVIFSFPACGGNIYINDFNPSGYTSSPNYPSNYPPHADCVWTITAPNGHAVELQFEDQFYIEPSPKYTSTLFCLCFFRDSILSLLLSLIPPRVHFQIYNQKWLGNYWERSLNLSGHLAYILRTLQILWVFLCLPK